MIWIIVAAIILAISVLPLLIPTTKTDSLPDGVTLADGNSKFLDINGISIHYKDFSPSDGTNSRSFILLHGFGSSMFSFRHLVPVLQRYGRVVLFDRPGSGLSARPIGRELEAYNPYTADAQRELTVEVMDALGIERAVVVAHSSGGPLAVEAAYHHPFRFDALVLLGPSLYNSVSVPPFLRVLLRTPQMAHIGPALIRATLSAEPGVPGRLLRMSWSDPSRIEEETMADSNRNVGLRRWDRSLWEMTLVLEQTEADLHITQLRLPIVVIAGDNDRVVPLKNHEHLMEELEGARLVVVARSGHNPQEEQPEECVAAVVEFLDEHVAAN